MSSPSRILIWRRSNMSKVDQYHMNILLRSKDVGYCLWRKWNIIQMSRVAYACTSTEYRILLIPKHHRHGQVYHDGDFESF